MKYHCTLLVLLFVSLIPLRGQLADQISTEELKLQAMFQRAKSANTDALKISINDSIVLQLEQVLNNPASISYPFDSLRLMGKISSPDGKIRIYTWNMVNSDITYRYYGLIQYVAKKNVKLYRLEDKAALDKNSTSLIYSPANWYGCLIYKIIQNRVEGRELYTLLATDMNNVLSGKKIIDCLWFDDKDAAFFGKPVFTTQQGQVQNRIIFEYAAQAVMGLKWESRADMILFDHLSPIQPGMEGNFKFYGPDLSIDGYRFEKGKWLYVSEVKL